MPRPRRPQASAQTHATASGPPAKGTNSPRSLARNPGSSWLSTTNPHNVTKPIQAVRPDPSWANNNRDAPNPNTAQTIGKYSASTPTLVEPMITASFMPPRMSKMRTARRRSPTESRMSHGAAVADARTWRASQRSARSQTPSGTSKTMPHRRLWSYQANTAATPRQRGAAMPSAKCTTDMSLSASASTAVYRTAAADESSVSFTSGLSAGRPARR